MTKDRNAQVVVRNLNKLSKRDHKSLVKWLKKVLLDVEKRDLDCAPVMRWSLMKVRER